MRKRISAFVHASLLAIISLVACKKANESEVVSRVLHEAVSAAEPECAKLIITDQPVKVGETGIVLPAKTRLCFSEDNLSIRIELPAGYAFLVKDQKTLPVFATYTCNCSVAGTACQVFYASGLGFGCLQSTCSGSCTGKFTYQGYSIDKVISTDSKEAFFSLPEIQKEIAAITSTDPYSKQSIYGISFYIVNNEEKFIAAATCNCGGTQACTLKKINIPLGPTIYFCQGSCNGCELTV
jgi:hypothetical protein